MKKSIIYIGILSLLSATALAYKPYNMEHPEDKTSIVKQRQLDARNIQREKFEAPDVLDRNEVQREEVRTKRIKKVKIEIGRGSRP
ncbi:MAG TPA: hypothetical protein VNJ08_05940 [Bacteriovoracaceae bacterium]|nr:hypothetical protein [Bacteriovoracaceae bacterium]